MLISAYFASLSPLALFRALPGSIAQGLIWGLLALGVYITYKLLDFADLSVDGSFATGGAVAVMLIRSDMNPWVSLIFAFAAGMLAGMITGLLHTKLGIPPILAGILTQIALYSINLNIMGQSNQAISVDKYSLAVSLRYVSGDTAAKIKVFTTCILFGVVIVAILYWYFGTEQGHSIRATGCNPQMARAQGINTSFCKVLALMISNGSLVCPVHFMHSIRVQRMSIWDEAQSLSVWLPLLSEMYCLENCVQERNWHLHIRYFP